MARNRQYKWCFITGYLWFILVINGAITGYFYDYEIIHSIEVLFVLMRMAILAKSLGPMDLQGSFGSDFPWQTVSLQKGRMANDGMIWDMWVKQCHAYHPPK